MVILILFTVSTLSLIGILSAIVLFVTAKKFSIEVDTRITQIAASLPGVNCGGCGYAGCNNFAEACSKAKDLEGLFCPVGGNITMTAVGKILGIVTIQKDSMVAVLKCNGAKQHRHQKNIYDSTESCRIVNALFRGESGCEQGCLRLADCVNVCFFDALHMNEQTGLPEVDENKCTACGKCVKTCPRHLYELRKKGPKNLRVYVTCSNTDPGGVARKNCLAACIGCFKCFDVCPFNAINKLNNLVYIDFDKCKLCRKCVTVCPTKAITEINFPIKSAQNENEKVKQ